MTYPTTHMGVNEPHTPADNRHGSSKHVDQVQIHLAFLRAAVDHEALRGVTKPRKLFGSRVSEEHFEQDLESVMLEAAASQKTKTLWKRDVQPWPREQFTLKSLDGKQNKG
ncbi:Paralemmin-3 [Manis pentadactyla]|nr:Paralemmin-3 [Manis pentadactyla]